jgi:hypothetical protein
LVHLSARDNPRDGSAYAIRATLPAMSPRRYSNLLSGFKVLWVRPVDGGGRVGRYRWLVVG